MNRSVLEKATRIRIGRPVPLAWSGLAWHVAIVERGKDRAAREWLEDCGVPVFAVEGCKAFRRGGSGPWQTREWLIMEGYGKTLSRPGCDTVTRELCIVAMLTVLGRKQQLTSHVRGALRAGATIQDLKEVEHAVTERCGARRSAPLLELILLQERRLTDG